MSRIALSRSNYPGTPHVMLATPSYTGALAASHTASLVQSIWALKEAGIAVTHVLMAENCHVDDARNLILTEFMDSECSDLIFLDADVAWSPPDLVKLIRYQDAPVVAGVYPRRAMAADDPFPVLPYREDKNIFSRRDGLVRVSGLPTGFMRIRRDVIEAAILVNDHRRVKMDNRLVTIVFERTLEDGKRWSGDYAFCRLVNEMGFKMYCAPEMRLLHEGTHEWSGCLGDHWRDLAGLDHPRFIKAIETLKRGNPDAECWAHLTAEFARRSGGYSAETPILAALHICAMTSGGPILELGSGLSTLVLASVAAHTGARVVTLEHDRGYYEDAKELLRSNGLARHVDLRCAPLEEYYGDGKPFLWYDVSAPGCDVRGSRFNLVFLDGPPRRFGRGGLFQVLGNEISNALIIADDAGGGQAPELEEWCAARKRPAVEFIESEGARTFAISKPGG